MLLSLRAYLCEEGTRILRNLTVAVLVEDGVNETEFHYIWHRLQEAEAEVLVVGTDRLKFSGEDHIALQAGITVNHIKEIDFDGVIIPGGLAPEKLRQNPKVIKLVRGIYEKGKICGAIHTPPSCDTR